MSLPTYGWSNKRGSSDRSCACGSWQKHWINLTGRAWPATCSVAGCTFRPTLGGHLVNAADVGEYIAPLCNVCNQREQAFSLKDEITLASATATTTCTSG